MIRRWNNTNAPINTILDYLKFYLVALIILVCLLYWGFSSSEKNSEKKVIEDLEDQNELRSLTIDNDEKYNSAYFSGNYLHIQFKIFV